MRRLLVLAAFALSTLPLAAATCQPDPPPDDCSLSCEHGRKTDSTGHEYCECRDTDACIEILAPPHKNPATGECIGFPTVCDIPHGWSACPSECSADECGPRPALPTVMCDDGSSAGPGECTRDHNGVCGWEITQCPPTRMCGGFAGIACPEGLACVDDPDDSCDPRTGGADCSGICVQDNACGDAHCGGGTVCCNASCGICTFPGDSCIQIACVDPR